MTQNETKPPIGNDTHIQNMTDFNWERLVSMRDEAQRINDYTEENNLDQCEFPFVLMKLNEEIQRRLLKILQ